MSSLVVRLSLRISIVGLAALVAACAASGPPVAPLTRFEPTFSSDDHLQPMHRIVVVRFAPGEVHDRLLAELRRSGATRIVEERDLRRRLEVSPDASGAWRRRRSAVQARWTAIKAANKADYDAAEPARPQAEGIDRLPDETVRGSSLRARVWERPARFGRTTVTLNSRRYREEEKPLASMIRFEIWGTDDPAESRVYMSARPVAERGEGGTLALEWLQFVDGADEVELIDSYRRVMRSW